MQRDLLLLSVVVLLLRLPFLDQAVQGDDVYYLLIARNALIDPLHPMQMGFRLAGETVWAAGHTRPPLNACVLGALLALFGEVRESYFHLFYLLFSLAAAFSMYFLARRFSRKPFLATLVFLVVPAFVVNGNKLEADIPVLALWMAAFSLFVHRRFLLAAVAMALAGLCAYQAVFAVPILAHYAWHRHRREWKAWLGVLAGPLALAGWQLFERVASGTAPAAVLAGYFVSCDLLALERKLNSTLALTGHLGFMASPLLVIAAWRPKAPREWLWLAAPFAAAFVPAALLADYSLPQRILLWLAVGSGLFVLVESFKILAKDRAGEEGFLAAWLLVFFAGSIVVFYAGSARYLLPLSAPLALLAVRRLTHGGFVIVAVLAHLALGLALAGAEYQYVNQYRAFARRLAPIVESRRLWSNAEWGLRYYLEDLGGEPLLRDQQVHSGAIVVTSELAAHIPFRAAGIRAEVLSAEVRTASIPLRHIGLGSRSGYSSSEFGVLPFDPGPGLIDRVTAYGIGLAEPAAGYLAMNSPEAEAQLLSGFYALEAGQWRWMGGEGTALLLAPRGAKAFELDFHIPDEAPARRVRVELDGETVADETYPATGRHTLQVPAGVQGEQSIQVRISVDRTFRAPGDDRDLGIIVHSFGLKSAGR